MDYKNALITGASSGLGRALAIELAKDGVKVFVAARRKEELDALVYEIKDLGGEAEALVLDVTDTVTLVETIRALDKRVDGLDLVVANAGIGVSVSGKHMTFESIESILRVNLMGAVATLTAVLPAMVERNRGHLVGISSLARARGLPKHAAYCASKAGLSTFLESLRLDLAKTNLIVSNVDPGFIRTPMTAPNKHPMPFMKEPRDAAVAIWKGLKRGSPQIRFPLPMILASTMLGVLPDPIYDLIFSSRTGVYPREPEH